MEAGKIMETYTAWNVYQSIKSFPDNYLCLGRLGSLHRRDMSLSLPGV